MYLLLFSKYTSRQILPYCARLPNLNVPTKKTGQLFCLFLGQLSSVKTNQTVCELFVYATVIFHDLDTTQVHHFTLNINHNVDNTYRTYTVWTQETQKTFSKMLKLHLIMFKFFDVVTLFYSHILDVGNDHFNGSICWWFSKDQEMIPVHH